MNDIDKDRYLAHIKDLEYKIHFLLNTYVKCEEDKFCFPDGEIWEVSKKRKNREKTMNRDACNIMIDLETIRRKR